VLLEGARQLLVCCAENRGPVVPHSCCNIVNHQQPAAALQTPVAAPAAAAAARVTPFGTARTMYLDFTAIALKVQQLSCKQSGDCCMGILFSILPQRDCP
jgi:hypothetical protein